MDRRTDDTTISVEPIFLKMCSKNTFFKEKLFTTEVQGILKGAWPAALDYSGNTRITFAA
jgi:hypothetical protein